MELQVLVDKVRSDWEQIFIETEDDVRNIFFNSLDIHISMGIGLEVISVDETAYLAGKIYLICEDDNEQGLGWADIGISENIFEGIADFMSETFDDWANNGAESGALSFPEEIANIIKQEGIIEFYGVNVFWNGEEMY